MNVLLTVLASIWAGVYTGSVAVALWRQRRYRGAIGTGLLTLLAVTVPLFVEWMNRGR